MVGLSLGIGLILIFLGASGYCLSGGASLTALIPAAFGVLYLVFGFIARTPSKRKHAMHGAAALSLIGLLATFTGFLKIFTLIGGGTVERPQAVIAQAVMALLCLIFLVFATRSFIQARSNPE